MPIIKEQLSTAIYKALQNDLRHAEGYTYIYHDRNNGHVYYQWHKEMLEHESDPIYIIKNTDIREFNELTTIEAEQYFNDVVDDAVFDIMLEILDKTEKTEKTDKTKTNPTCSFCDSDLEYTEVNNTHVWSCTECPVVSFEYYTGKDLDNLKTYLKEE